jgi:hypothetical protein
MMGAFSEEKTWWRPSIDQEREPTDTRIIARVAKKWIVFESAVDRDHHIDR